MNFEVASPTCPLFKIEGVIRSSVPFSRPHLKLVKTRVSSEASSSYFPYVAYNNQKNFPFRKN